MRLRNLFYYTVTSILLFSPTLSIAETYICSHESYGENKSLVQRVLVRESQNVFVDKSKTWTDLNVRIAFIVYSENEKGLILVDEPYEPDDLYPYIGVTLIQKDTGKMYHTNLTGNFVKLNKHNKRFREGVCTRID